MIFENCPACFEAPKVSYIFNIITAKLCEVGSDKSMSQMVCSPEDVEYLSSFKYLIEPLPCVGCCMHATFDNEECCRYNLPHYNADSVVTHSIVAPEMMAASG